GAASLRETIMIYSPHDMRIAATRRDFLMKSGAVTLALASGACLALAQPGTVLPLRTADHTITIEPLSLELSPGKLIKTYGYNGSAPGPVIRLREGHEVKTSCIGTGCSFHLMSTARWKKARPWCRPADRGATPLRRAPAGHAGITAIPGQA